MAQAEKDLGNVRGPQGEKGLTGDQGPRGEEGPRGLQGDVGPAAGFGTITATIDGGNGEPSVEASWDGEDTAKNVTIEFHNLVGERGETGPAGPKGDPGDWTPTSDTDHVVLGDGSTISIDELVEQIREKLGAPTTSKGGLVTLPENPNVEE